MAKQNVPFTREQVMELEDKILNALNPISVKIEMIPQMGLKQSDIDVIMNRIDYIVKYIRGLRPVSKRIR